MDNNDIFNVILKNAPIRFGILAIVLICIHTVVIKSIIEFYLDYKPKQLFPIITEIINLIYWNPLLYIYNSIIPNIPFSGKFFVKLSTYLNKLKLSWLFLDCAIIFDYIPRLLIAISFMVDVLVYNNMFHFYSVVTFILIPITYKIVLKMYLDFPLRNYSIYDKYFEVIITETGSYRFIPRNGYKLSDILCDEWAELKDIEILATMFQQTCIYFSKPIYLVTSVCYVLSWVYILFICLGIL